MVDPIVAGGAVAVGKALNRSEKSDGLLKRMLGPPADAVGLWLASLVEKRTDNAQRIMENAAGKLGDKIDEPGEVPYRIAGRILEEGSWCDDDVAVEYLGGVLASSRSGVSRDDRGAKWVALITQLSSYELRLHYVLYSAVRRYTIERDLHVNWANADEIHGRVGMLISPWREIERAMEFESDEHGPDIFSESTWGLSARDLLANFFTRTADTFRTDYGRVPDPSGMYGFVPTRTGVGLYLWAMGHGRANVTVFNDPQLEVAALDFELPTLVPENEVPPIEQPTGGTAP